MAQFDTNEIVLGSSEWKTAPFRFNRMTNLGGSDDSYTNVLLSGVSPLALTNALGLNYVKAFGKCEQSSTPTPTNPVDIICNNGTLTLDSTTQQIIAVGTTETVTDNFNNTATMQNLLSIWDGDDESIIYKDEQDILTGNITRRVGFYALTGNESFRLVASENLFYSNNTLAALNPLGLVNCLCNYYRGKKTSRNRQIGDCYITSSGRLDILDDRFNTAEDFKSWLAERYAAGNPVIVVFPLETPITEKVSKQTLTAEGNCTITATGSLNNLELELSYKQSI